MNAVEFLDFILQKHHEGESPEEGREVDPTWEYDDHIEPRSDGCELISAVDK